jgi:hypothetical protein
VAFTANGQSIIVDDVAPNSRGLVASADSGVLNLAVGCEADLEVDLAADLRPWLAQQS